MSVQSISPVLFESVSAVTATPSIEVGTERTVDGEKYVYLYNCGISTISTGKGVTRPASAAAGLYSVSVSSVSGDMPLAFVKHASVDTLNYFWGLKKGLVTVAVASSASDQAAGPKALGALGLVATLGAGYAQIGELTTAIVSGNSGALYVNLA